MSEVNFYIESKDKAGIYKEFMPQFRALLTGETEEVSILANASAALRQVFDFFWVGFLSGEGRSPHRGTLPRHSGMLHHQVW